MKKIDILLVEDNESEIILTLEMLKEENFNQTTAVVKDGEEAINFLYKRGEFETARTPDLILLDINLPKINGLEVLRTIKKDPDLKVIPVVMLTTSDSNSDIMKAYKNHANCYITKPVDLLKFMNIIKLIKEFWALTVTLPSGNGAD